MTHTELFEKALAFVHEIGIKTSYRKLNEKNCFLPGFLIENGCIIIDPELMKYPGDILHEAGHIAIVPAKERILLNGPTIGERQTAPSEEMTAIAWSYAACKHLNIDPSFVFHEHGYKGGGKNIVQNFDEGRYFGVPVLQWLGMTTTNSDSHLPVYPAMIKWMRD